MNVLRSIILILSFCATTAAATASPVDLKNKSLRVGPQDNPSPFAVCVATQAVDQLMQETYSFSELLYSVPDPDTKPPVTATLLFFARSNLVPKTEPFQVILKSLDTTKGWQLIRHENGEIAPFSTLISEQAFVIRMDGSEVGNVNLSTCADR